MSAEEEEEEEEEDVEEEEEEDDTEVSEGGRGKAVGRTLLARSRLDRLAGRRTTFSPSFTAKVTNLFESHLLTGEQSDCPSLQFLFDKTVDLATTRI